MDSASLLGMKESRWISEGEQRQEYFAKLRRETPADGPITAAMRRILEAKPGRKAKYPGAQGNEHTKQHELKRDRGVKPGTRRSEKDDKARAEFFKQREKERKEAAYQARLQAYSLPSLEQAVERAQQARNLREQSRTLPKGQE